MNEEAVKALFGIDFDGTIANGHIHNTIYHSEETDHEKQWELVKSIKPIGGAQAWNELFHILHEDGHHIAIVSFNAYPHIIRRYLIEIIKLDGNFVDTYIPIISFTPENQSNKAAHLLKANESLGVAARLVILIDDAYRNYLSAMESGHILSIHAKSNGSHIKEIRERSKSVKKPKPIEKVIEKENELSSSSDSMSGLVGSLTASMEKLYHSGELRRSRDEAEINPLKSSRENLKFN